MSRTMVANRLTDGRRFADAAATDRILSRSRDQREDREAAFIRSMISAHTAGLHTELAKLGGGPGPQGNCPRCACSS
jgi:hypothetical protein